MDDDQQAPFSVFSQIHQRHPQDRAFNKIQTALHFFGCRRDRCGLLSFGHRAEVYVSEDFFTSSVFWRDVPLTPVTILSIKPESQGIVMLQQSCDDLLQHPQVESL